MERGKTMGKEEKKPDNGQEMSGKTEHEPEKKKKKVSARMIIGILIMLAGAGVFCYPLAVQAYNAHLQKKMIAEIKAEMLANMAENEEETSPESETEIEPTPIVTSAAATPAVDKAEPTPIEAGNILGDALTQITDAPDEENIEEETNSNRLSGRKVIGLIEIEAISLIYPIVEGTAAEDIGVAIGHMTETASFGEIGNCALAGHRGGYSGPYFKNLHKLKDGDKVVITDAKGTEYVYLVTESMIVQPTDIWVVEDTGDEVAMLTLVTCEDNGKERLIVRCEME